MLILSVLALLEVIVLIDGSRLSWCAYFRMLGEDRPECATAPVQHPRNDGIYRGRGTYKNFRGNQFASKGGFPSQLNGGVNFFVKPRGVRPQSSWPHIKQNQKWPTTPKTQYYQSTKSPTLITRDYALQSATSAMKSSYEEYEEMTTTQQAIIATIEFCNPEQHLTSCRRHRACPSGQACRQNGRLCCVDEADDSKKLQCPNPHLLGHSCNVNYGINWCYSDKDCHMPHLQKCCPTPCNYNICVHVGPPKQRPISGVLAKPFSHCPAMETLAANCKREQRYISWCETDSDCSSKNKLQKRICCPTKCDYKVCLLDWLGQWIIA